MTPPPAMHIRIHPLSPGFPHNVCAQNYARAGLGSTFATSKITAAELMAQMCTQAAWLIKWPGRQFVLEGVWLEQVMYALVAARDVLSRWGGTTSCTVVFPCWGREGARAFFLAASSTVCL